MKKAAMLVSMGILFMICGCSKSSRQAAAKSTPVVVQAAAPPASYSQVSLPDPSQMKSLIPLPDKSGLQGILVQGNSLTTFDQNFGADMTLSLDPSGWLSMKLGIANNSTSAPLNFGVKDVTITVGGENGSGKDLAVLPKTSLPRITSNGTNLFALVGANYWDDSVTLVPNHSEEHFLYAFCGKECSMPVYVNVVVEGRTNGVGGKDNPYLFSFTDSPPDPTIRIIDSLNIDDVTDRCGQPDGKNIGLASFLTYGHDFNTGAVEGTEYDSVTLHFEYNQNGIVDAQAYRHGSNHPVQIGKYSVLPKVMPCLLEGGVAK